MQFTNTIEEITNLVEKALIESFELPQDINPKSLIEITDTNNRKFGHYQCNSAMRLTKMLKQPPREIAANITSHIEKNAANKIFSKIEIAGPGFINFTLSSGYLNKYTQERLKEPKFGLPILKTPQKAIIDFSSPNIAKEMHVGHLRSTVIGDSIARTLEFLGYDVLRLNHVGDWGTQFGMLITYLKNLPEFENNASNFDLTFLMQSYKAAKKQFDEDEKFKTTAQQEVVKLQAGDATSIKIWQQICAISRQAFQEIYDILDIKLVERGESFYNPMLKDTVKYLEDKGLVEISDGAKCIYLDGYKNRDGDPLPLIIEKSDGGFNYATTDLATINYRTNTENADWLIYVTDKGQAQHFEMVYTAARQAGIYTKDKVRVDHVPFGVVLKEDGKKYKTREGDTEKLIDLIHTAINKAANILKNRTPDLSDEKLKLMSENLGINAIKYADLSNNRISDYKFSFDKMLQFEGNTAAYLSYAYVRIASINRKVGTDINKLKQSATINLVHPTELELGFLISQFGDVLTSASNDLMPNRIADYLYRLADAFQSFYQECKIKDEPEQNSRLLLAEVVRNTLETGMKLLGLKVLQEM